MDTLRTDTLHIVGGRPLRGRVRVGGAKNAALPLLAAAVLPGGETTFRRVPNLSDVRRLGDVLTGLGVRVRHRDGAVTVDPARLDSAADPDPHLTGGMRGSVCLLGPLLARCGRVSLAAVGGCDLGPRPLDRHLRAFAAMGARVEQGLGGRVTLSSSHLPGGRLRGARVNLSAPIAGGDRGVRVPTVTGTANVLCAAATADGMTVIRGAAREPEVVAVGRFLNACGARITGLGTGEIHVVGVDRLLAPPAGHAACRVPADRVEAATWLCAAAATRGRLTIDGIGLEPLAAVADALRAMGAGVRACGTVRSPRVCVSASGPLAAVELRAGAFPAVPTDVLPQLAAVALTAAGTSLLTDGVFPDRLAHLPRLARFGGSVGRAGATAIVTGEPRLHGALADAPDLRAGAALLIAALAADGRSELHAAGVLARGYERLVPKLRDLGADVSRTAPEDVSPVLRRVMTPEDDDLAPPDRPRWRAPAAAGMIAGNTRPRPEMSPCPLPSAA